MTIVAKSAARTAAVLDYFQHRRRPARARDIARGLGLAASSASDLLGTLVDVGILDFDAKAKTYAPSLRLAFQTCWLRESLELATRLEELMDDIRLATGESVVLSALRNARLQFLHVRGGTNEPPPQVADGLYAPVFGTAAGGALLMTLPDRSIPALVRQVTRLRTGGELRLQVAATLDQAWRLRRQGYAHVAETEFLPDAWALALPLSAAASPQLALGVGGPGRLASKDADELVKLLAGRIQGHLPAACR